jgi:hypothetical protein
VAFARTLPYTGFVIEMGSNGVHALQTGRLLHTRLQAHGVDVLDGTPYAYITNLRRGEPGTVSQIDVRTRRVVRTFTVGLGPAHVVFTPDHRRAFVTDFRSSDLYRLDLRSSAPRRIAFRVWSWSNSTCGDPGEGVIPPYQDRGPPANQPQRRPIGRLASDRRDAPDIPHQSDLSNGPGGGRRRVEKRTCRDSIPSSMLESGGISPLTCAVSRTVLLPLRVTS